MMLPDNLLEYLTHHIAQSAQESITRMRKSQEVMGTLWVVLMGSGTSAKELVWHSGWKVLGFVLEWIL